MMVRLGQNLLARGRSRVDFNATSQDVEKIACQLACLLLQCYLLIYWSFPLPRLAVITGIKALAAEREDTTANTRTSPQFYKAGSWR